LTHNDSFPILLPTKSEYLSLKNQKPGVVGDQGKLFSFCGLVPPNELVPGLDLPGSTCPGKISHDLAIDVDQAFEILAHQLGQAQIMIVMNQKVP